MRTVGCERAAGAREDAHGLAVADHHAITSIHQRAARRLAWLACTITSYVAASMSPARRARATSSNVPAGMIGRSSYPSVCGIGTYSHRVSSSTSWSRSISPAANRCAISYALAPEKPSSGSATLVADFNAAEIVGCVTPRLRARSV